jgi:hypothetical protein
LLLIEKDDVGDAQLHGLGEHDHTHHAGTHDEIFAHVLIKLQWQRV